MANGRIEIKHIFTDETDYVVWTIRKVTNLLALVPATFYDGTTTLTNVTKFAYPAPHPQSVMVLTDIAPVIYLATAYRSSDGVSLDEELDVQLVCDAGSGNVYSADKYEYVVDRGDDGSELDEVWADPETGDHGIRDERLLNKRYWISERGTGLLLNAEIIDRSDDGGGFDFADPDKNFEAPGVYIAIVWNLVASDSGGGGGSGGGSDFNSVELITGDMSFDPVTMNNKVLVAAYAGSNKVVTVSIPNLDVASDCKFRVITHGGTQRYIAIQLDAGDTVEFLGEDDWNVLYLGKGETIEIMIVDSVMYITNYDGDYKKVGREDGVKGLEINGIYADGTQYQQADVPRLMQWIDRKGISTVTEAVWAAATSVDYMTNEGGAVTTQNVYINKGRYARDDSGGTIRVPDLRNMFRRFMKYTDGSDDAEREVDFPGGLQVDSFLEHLHRTTNSDSTPGSGKMATGGQVQEGANLFTLKTKGMSGVETRGINVGDLPQITI